MNAYTAALEVRSVPRVTLYVKDEDSPVWDRARRLSGAGDESLSSLVSDALRERVEQLEAQQKIDAGESATVTLEVDDPPKKIRFTGRLLASTSLGGGADAQIYQMKDGRVVYFEENYAGNIYKIEDSLDQLKQEFEIKGSGLAGVEDLLREAYDAVGEEFIIDLD